MMQKKRESQQTITLYRTVGAAFPKRAIPILQKTMW